MKNLFQRKKVENRNMKYNDTVISFVTERDTKRNYVEEGKIAHIAIGELVTATQFAADFNLTREKEYEVLDYDGDCILIRDDLGVEGWYALEYFREFSGLYA